MSSASRLSRQCRCKNAATNELQIAAQIAGRYAQHSLSNEEPMPRIRMRRTATAIDMTPCSPELGMRFAGVARGVRSDAACFRILRSCLSLNQLWNIVDVPGSAIG